jgi:hypothetical protein
LFVKTQDGKPLSEKHKKQINDAIASRLSRRHVPARIITGPWPSSQFLFHFCFVLTVNPAATVPDLPYTGNGKKLEVGVKKLINGADRKSVGAISRVWFDFNQLTCRYRSTRRPVPIRRACSTLDRICPS